MSAEQSAYDDLITTLKALPWLSVYEEKGKSGGRKWSLEVFRGATSFIRNIGCRKIFNNYNLTLMQHSSTAPDDLAEKINIIDATITNDRRRGGYAQTTIMSEDGWSIDEEEGREAFSISTSLTIQIHEV